MTLQNARARHRSVRNVATVSTRSLTKLPPVKRGKTDFQDSCPRVVRGHNGIGSQLEQSTYPGIGNRRLHSHPYKPYFAVRWVGRFGYSIEMPDNS